MTGITDVFFEKAHSKSAAKLLAQRKENIMYAVNHLPLRDMAKSTTGCCPPFDPAEWDGQTFTFKDKPFMKFETRSLFHIPLNMNSQMTKALAAADEASARNATEYLMLSDEVSPWKAEHYLSVERDIPRAKMARLNGTYVAKVFEGDFKEMRNWYSQLIDYTKSRGFTPVKTFFSYTMCPNCAKAYGHNYVVGFEQIA